MKAEPRFLPIYQGEQGYNDTKQTDAKFAAS